MNKSIGLPFKAELVPKVLSGVKTQTRRLPGIHNCRLIDIHTGENKTGKMKNLDWNDIVVGDIPYPNGELIHFHVGILGSSNKLYGLIPRHKPGDIAWMREMWRRGTPAYNGPDFDSELCYRADQDKWPDCKWKPSIHMFRWASRWERPLKSVRIELIQDISEDDALAEGIEEDNVIVGATGAGGSHHEITGIRYDVGTGEWEHEDACSAFAELWDRINAARGWSWELNRPVVVYDWKDE